MGDTLRRRKEITELANQDITIKEKIDKVCTILGVGLQTAVTVIAETNGFNLIRNSRQLVSYAGTGRYTKEIRNISKRKNAYIKTR